MSLKSIFNFHSFLAVIILLAGFLAVDRYYAAYEQNIDNTYTNYH